MVKFPAAGQGETVAAEDVAAAGIYLRRVRCGEIEARLLKSHELLRRGGMMNVAGGAVAGRLGRAGASIEPDGDE